jgi:hypothetical protein
MELDLPRILEVLDRNKVSYILIGGMAAVYHGSPFPTEDADITPEMDRRNLDKLAAALRELHARIRPDSEPEGLPFRCDGEVLAAGQIWNLTTDAGDLDVTFKPSGTPLARTAAFSESGSRAVYATIPTLRCAVAQVSYARQPSAGRSRSVSKRVCRCRGKIAGQ